MKKITTTSIFMALKKEHLLKYCQENNIKVFKSWNKNKIVDAMIKAQSEKEIQEQNTINSSDKNKEVENLNEKLINFPYEFKNSNIIDNRDKKEITIKTSNLTMIAKYHDRYSKILDKTYKNEVYEYCLMNNKNEIIYQSGNNLSILIYEEKGYISIKSYIDEVVYALENNLISLIENFMYLNGVGSTIHAIRKHKNIV